MVFRVNVSPTGLADIEALLLNQAEISLECAAAWLLGLETATKSLSELPLRCSLAYESCAFNMKVRQLLYGKGMKFEFITYDILGSNHSIKRTFPESNLEAPHVHT